jgi:hypothetical protein
MDILQRWRTAIQSCSHRLSKLAKDKPPREQKMEEKDMDSIFVLGPDNESPVKVGHSLVISKTIEVAFINFGNVVRTSDDEVLRLSDWNWKFTTPRMWPPQPGDVWRAGGIDYMAMKRSDMLVLEPSDSEIGRSYLPMNWDSFLKLHPVLKWRS